MGYKKIDKDDYTVVIHENGKKVASAVGAIFVKTLPIVATLEKPIRPIMNLIWTICYRPKRRWETRR